MIVCGSTLPAAGGAVIHASRVIPGSPKGGNQTAAELALADGTMDVRTILHHNFIEQAHTHTKHTHSSLIGPGCFSLKIVSLWLLQMEDITASGLFKEPAERERWLDIYGDRRFPGTTCLMFYASYIHAGD